MIYEILSTAATGASKTKIIFRVNLNHKLAERYAFFLVKRGLLKLESDDERSWYTLTERGERLLRLLREVEKELDDLYTMSLATDLIARHLASRTHPSFGNERGRVPIEIQRAASS